MISFQWVCRSCRYWKSVFKMSVIHCSANVQTKNQHWIIKRTVCIIIYWRNRATKMFVAVMNFNGTRKRNTNKQTNFVTNFYDNSACGSVTAFQFVLFSNVGKSKWCDMPFFLWIDLRDYNCTTSLQITAGFNHSTHTYINTFWSSFPHTQFNTWNAECNKVVTIHCTTHTYTPQKKIFNRHFVIIHRHRHRSHSSQNKHLAT